MNIRLATPADARAIAQVHVASWLSTYRGIVPDENLRKLNVDSRTLKWQEILAHPKPGTWDLVAVDDAGAICGFVVGGPERSGDPDFKGELYAIYLLETSQRQGLGTRLTLELATRLKADGWTSMLVWVLEANPSCRFYEALGGVRARQKDVPFSGTPLSEIGYGWSDLDVLIERAHKRLA